MKRFSISALSIFLLFSNTYPAQTAVQKARQAASSGFEKALNFASRHKTGILVTGGTAAAAALTYHLLKTRKAVLDAGFKKGTKDFREAFATVGFFGPIGMKNTAQLIKTAINKKWVTKDKAASIVMTDVAKALSNYWGTSVSVFREAAGFKLSLWQRIKMFFKPLVAAEVTDSVQNHLIQGDFGTAFDEVQSSVMKRAEDFANGNIAEGLRKYIGQQTVSAVKGFKQ